MSENVKNFGRTSLGDTKLYTLSAGRYSASVTDFGATLVSFCVRDDGRTTDVVLGYDDAAGYEAGGDSFGATVGRNANRTSGASFELNGRRYYLTANENSNNLHSGPDVYGKRIFRSAGITDINVNGTGEEKISENESDVFSGKSDNEDKLPGQSVTFTLDSPDGDQGFPGNLKLSVTYTLTSDGALEIRYRASSDRDTVCNPTNHTYFNLNGQGAGDIENTVIRIDADSFTPTGDGSIPTGEIRDVQGTAYDFREAKSIGQDIRNTADEQIVRANGYDQNFCLNGEPGKLRRCAWAFSPDAGIGLDVFTDLPGLQFYTGNFIQAQTGKSGAKYGPRSGFALESQYYPDGMNQAGFPKPVLKAGEAFDSRTVYKLSTERFSRREN